MWLNDLSPEARIGLAVVAAVAIVRLFALLSQELDRPAAAPPAVAEADDAPQPLRQPSRFAPLIEHLAYDREINRASTDVILSRAERTRATTALVRATAELDAMLAETAAAPPATQGVRAPAGLTRDDLVALLDLLPDTDAAYRARLVAFIDARLAENGHG